MNAVPNNRRARKLLAAALIRTRDPETAIKVLEPLFRDPSNDAQVLTLLGSAHMQMGRHDKAISYYSQAAQIAPDIASIRTQLALGNLARGKPDNAIGQLEQALDLDPEAKQAAVLLALVKLREGDFAGAQATAETLAQRLPNNPLPLNLIGAAQIGKGDIEAARKTFEGILTEHPDFHASRMNMAQLELREGKVEPAERHYREIVKRNPKHIGAMLALSEIALRRNRSNDAVSWLKKASDADPKAMAPRLRLIRFHTRLRDFRKALAVARELKQNVPNHPRVLEALGRAEAAAGEPVLAVATFTRLTTLTRNSPNVLGLLAGAQIAAKDSEAARETLKKAIALDPNYVPVRVALIELEAREGYFDKAMKLANSLRDQRPNLAIGDMLVGDVLVRQQKFDQAAKVYDAAMAKSETTALAIRRFNARRRAEEEGPALVELQAWVDRKKDRTARHVLASAYLMLAHYEDAIRETTKLLEVETNNPVLLNNLAWLYHQKRDGRALEYGERALALAPRSAAIMDTVGWILVETGQASKGLKLLETASGLAPKQGDIHYHMAVALHRNGKRMQAREELERLLGSGIEFSKVKEARNLLNELTGVN